MKRFVEIGFVLLLCIFCVSGCTNKNDITNNQKQATNVQYYDESDIRNVLLSKLGSEDANTGEKYDFRIIDTVEINNYQYFYGEWYKISVDKYGSFISEKLFCTFLVKSDGTECFKGSYDYDNSKPVYKDGINLFE